MKEKYDVVIVGTGVAGCFAALHLSENMDVLMITKGELEESDSFLAQGGICVQKDDDDYDSFYEDTMRAGHYENRPESVDFMISSSRSVIEELIRYGVEFEREKQQLRYTREGAHSTNRILFHEDITGEEITSKLLNQVKQRKNIQILTHTTMLDILCSEKGCDGILLKTADDQIKAVFADDVIWACGGIGGIYDNSTNFPHLTGDAVAISIRHGIRLKNISYVQIHPTTLFSKDKDRRFLISESVRGEGAHLYNKDGERFVDELLPRDVVSNAIFKQMEKDGMDHVWLSFLPIKDLDVRTRFPHIYQRCLEEGYDITKDWIPVVPAQHYFMGGVDVDLCSRTSMNHLYAAGETCCNGVHGANRLASNSLLESLVFAESAAKDIVAKRLANNAASQRFQEYLGEDLAVLAKHYGLDLAAFRDMERYMDENKRKIRDAIVKDKKETA